MNVFSTAIVILLATILPGRSDAQARVDSNVVYGMYSGLALLMDVYYPVEANGLGVVAIIGSGFHEPLSYDAVGLKDGEDLNGFLAAESLLQAGYTIFAINHRAAPRFRYPAAVEDVQRAVRHIRHSATRYEVNPNRLGAIGHSSGGYLATMLGVLDGAGKSNDASLIGRQSSKVQAVVALAAPSDFFIFASGATGDKAALGSFLGTYLAEWRTEDIQQREFRLYAEASPVSHVSSDDPPILLIHGDQDPVVPFNQSELLEGALRESGVTVELIRILGGGHGLRDPAGGSAADYFDQMVAWFDQNLSDDS